MLDFWWLGLLTASLLFASFDGDGSTEDGEEPTDPVDPVDPDDTRELVDGTEGDDTLTASGAQIVNGLDGEDTLLASVDTDTGSSLSGGAGDDLLSIQTNTGSDTTGTVEADGGAGDDILEAVITVDGTTTTPQILLSGGEGADVFEIDLQPDANDGGPTPASDAGAIVQITDFVRGTDALVVPGLIDQVGFEGSLDDNEYYLDEVTFTPTQDSDGTDVTLNYASTNSDEVLAATIRVLGAEALTVDDVQIVDSPSEESANENAIGLATGTDAGDIAVLGGPGGIITGAGDDQITATDDSGFASLGDGNDTLTATDAGGNYYGGDGDDTFVLDGAPADVNIVEVGSTTNPDGSVTPIVRDIGEGPVLNVHGGDGEDTFTVTGGPATAYGNDGDDAFLSENSSDGGSEFHGGAGNDSFTLVAGDSAFGSADTSGSLLSSDNETVVINTGAAATTDGAAIFDDLGADGTVTINIAADIAGEVTTTQEADTRPGPRGSTYDVTRTDVSVGDTIVATIYTYAGGADLSVDNGNLVINRPGA